MLLDRRPRQGPDPLLDWKVRLFFAGAVLLLVGMALDRRVMVGAGVAVLVAAFALRFFDRRPPVAYESDEADEADDGSGGADEPGVLADGGAERPDGTRP
jgi:hypothetical protein